MRKKTSLDSLCLIVDSFQLISLSLIVWNNIFLDFCRSLCSFSFHPGVIIRFFIASPFSWGNSIKSNSIYCFIRFCVCAVFYALSVGFFPLILFFSCFRLQLRRKNLYRIGSWKQSALHYYYPLADLETFLVMTRSLFIFLSSAWCVHVPSNISKRDLLLLITRNLAPLFFHIRVSRRNRRRTRSVVGGR